MRFEMTPAAVDRLVATSWLDAASRHNRDAVVEAFLKFGATALWSEG
ncbi:hypothetical protein QEV83_01590 [Methylocapsa sp. D3K7]|nr:hypothetical protein [Methylocapsa sp. D3K7]WGJ15029.1 hypothetical protein QEV83_01590 [Methylocapsa sp. D3K7]